MLDNGLPNNTLSSANTYQQAVLDFVRTGSGHGVVEATAGSGKTTTLVMVARLLVDEVLGEAERACFLAFNRSTAAELRSRLPAQVEAATLHSLGRQILADSRTAPLALEPAKYKRLAQELLVQDGLAAPTEGSGLAESAAYLSDLLGFARLELAELSDAGRVAVVRSRYGLRPPLPEPELLALERRLPALAQAGSNDASIDYTDMIYLPVRLGLPAPRYAFICVDEAQDLSRMALGLVERLIQAGARALFVGDPFQAIYAFAGADARSLSRITRLTDAKRLPLSVSFRCPVRHVVLARRFSPAMSPASNAPNGTVKVTTAERLPRLARPGDLIMARTNAPLPDLAIDLAAAGTPVRVLGYDLVEQAKTLADELFAAGHLVDAEQSVRHSAEAERVRLEFELLTSDELPEQLERSGHGHAVLLLALRSLTARSWSIDLHDVESELDRLFAGAGEHVLLSTIHKAKGREADRTFLLFPERLGIGQSQSNAAADDAADDPADDLGGDDPADDPNDDPDLAEANVLFVALTRAKRELVLVECEPGAVATRLKRDAEAAPKSLTRRWNDVLRLASVMSRGTDGRGLSSGHGEARRVQDRRRQAGRSRRRTHP